MLTTILTFIGSILTGPVIAALLQGWSASLKARNTSEQIQASLEAQKATLDAQQQQVAQATLVAEEGRFGPWIRYAIGGAIAFRVAKVFVWDSALHLGTTDALSPEMLSVENAVIWAFFGHAAFVTAARAIARKGS